MKYPPGTAAAISAGEGEEDEFEGEDSGGDVVGVSRLGRRAFARTYRNRTGCTGIPK